MTLEPEIQHVLYEGRQAHVAVVSRNGPHVTPELYAWSGGRLWFWFARTTLKAKVLATSPDVAVLVTVGDTSIAIEGTVDLIDVHRPTTLLGSPARSLRAGKAVGRYVARNAEDLGAFARDLATGRLGWRPPPARVLASVEPAHAAIVADRRAVPPPGGERVVVALPGPAVVPGRWFAHDAELWVDPALLARFDDGADELPAAVVADAYVAPGPDAKVGTLLRGTARRLGPDRWSIEADTLTTWDGIAMSTHTPSDAPGG